MNPSPVHLPGAVALLPSPGFLDDIGNQFSPLLHELNLLAGQGVLPARLEEDDRGWRLFLHTSTRVLRLYPSRGGDAYTIARAHPRGFRDEAALLKQALLLTSRHGFRAFPDMGEFNRSVAGSRVIRSNHDDTLWDAWNAQLDAPAPHASPHEHRLALMDLVVQAARDIELGRVAERAPHQYASRGDAKEERHSARGVYRFRMLRRPELAVNTVVCLGDAPDLRGVVIRVDGNEVTVRFEPGADFRRIGAQGTLMVLPSDRVFRAQLKAIDTLRRGGGRNPQLLDALLDGAVRPYAPDTSVQPAGRLDGDQREALGRSAAVPDVLCVLGPPGTGKTTTIVEMVRAAVQRGERVLVTSHTHRAVDNVLENLPADMNVVRFGNEDRMSARVKALSAESQAETARREILADTAALDQLAAQHSHRPLAEQHLTHLDDQLRRLTAAEQETRRLDAALLDVVAPAGSPLRRELDQAAAAITGHREQLAQLQRAVDAVGRRIAFARRIAADLPFLAFLSNWFIAWQSGHAAAAGQSQARIRVELAAAEAAHRSVLQQAETLAASTPAARGLLEARAAAQRATAAARAQAEASSGALGLLLGPLFAPPAPQPTVEDWRRYHGDCRSGFDLIERRHALLQEWRARCGDLTTELQNEIARYADVLGATCIGTDTSARIAEMEFDLTIVDEAGQISLPNLLVPLIRSQRMVLVGDHRQLPPYLDDELRRWGDDVARHQGLTAQEIGQVRDLLVKSGFETLFPRLGPANAVWLRTQRRMPAEIAQFVSRAFYDGRLATEHPGARPADLFRSPFAMVNTADRPLGERGETALNGPRGGFRNELEAKIIADLLVHHQEQYPTWAVIVPFNAQRELVLKELNVRQGLPLDAAEHVGTVDSFQGGERDLIIFGFTRSNAAGRIGFLRELRRFNVAVTRARRLLVLVGDLDTLTAAEHRAFRDVMRDMRTHLTGSGHVRGSIEIEKDLRERGMGQPW
ncbi:hypothetical protein CS0771_48060 [Catellatospora sp. IY07-71]|uniref:DEAD/DEAH box helicase n=1 Tax=Catellatospora sp. IY07-71 TaxID=2728827 RepID=UPI001BB37854|nr:AAA domain-containing protein [Catellatospora sp. IY07-71]BCJ75262.1 hypothetical protein CS0771_48060 [Catellatospora sp. IY07-71]